MTGVGRDRQVMTEYINSSCKFQRLKKMAKRKEAHVGIRNKILKFLEILKKENHKYYLTE